MADTTKRITLTVRMPVTIIVDAEESGGEVNVVRVIRAYPPTAVEVMEALDNEGQLGELDEAYENPTGDAA
jgi:hypothetical protein